VIVLPDSETWHGTDLAKSITCATKRPVPVSIFPTGPVCPADKRDLALKYAKGEIIAFIDDDAYPQPDWLKNAVINFKDESVAAVGGPAVTPAEDNLRQQASGRVYASFLVSGTFVYRYVPKTKREVDDFPSCNFLVRKSAMQELGGFKTSFWPGEDTKFCLDITGKLKKKIIYDPKVLVFHHRRQLYLAHLAQVANYALHRGYFVKKYPQTSLRFAYFMPSLFLLALFCGGIMSLFFPALRLLYLSATGLYLFSALIFSFNRDLRLMFLVFSGTILTHLAYGVYFIKGLLSLKLKEES